MMGIQWQLEGEAVGIDPTEARKIAEQRLAQEMEEELTARKAKAFRKEDTTPNLNPWRTWLPDEGADHMSRQPFHARHLGTWI